MKRPEGYVDPRRAANIAAVLAALPGTRGQIIERTELHKDTVRKILRKLHGKELRVGRWKRHPVHGPSIAVFVRGGGADAPDNLPRMTSAQRSARYEAKIKGTWRHDRRKAKQLSYYFAKRAAAAPKNWASALFATGRKRRDSHA